MLKLKLQYFGHLMQRADSLEKTPMLQKIEAWRRRGGTTSSRLAWEEDNVCFQPSVVGPGARPELWILGPALSSERWWFDLDGDV